MAADDITLGELARRLDSFERRFDSQILGVSRQIEGLQFVHRDTYDAQMSALDDRVELLEDRNRWQARALVTALVFPVFVALILAAVLTQ